MPGSNASSLSLCPNEERNNLPFLLFLPLPLSRASEKKIPSPPPSPLSLSPWKAAMKSPPQEDVFSVPAQSSLLF